MTKEKAWRRLPSWQQGARDGGSNANEASAQGNRAIAPVEVSAGAGHSENQGFNPGERYELRNDGGNIVLVNTRTGETKVYHAEPETRRHKSQDEAAKGARTTHQKTILGEEQCAD